MALKEVGSRSGVDGTHKGEYRLATLRVVVGMCGCGGGGSSSAAQAQAGFLTLLFLLLVLSSQHSALFLTEGSLFVLLPR